MHDVGIFLAGVGVSAIVALALALLTLGALRHRHDDRIRQRALYESLVERTRETAQDRSER